MSAFDIFINGKYFDTVVFETRKTCEEVRAHYTHFTNVVVKSCRFSGGQA